MVGVFPGAEESPDLVLVSEILVDAEAIRRIGCQAGTALHVVEVGASTYLLLCQRHEVGIHKVLGNRALATDGDLVGWIA